MMSMTQCALLAGLAPNEIILGAEPSNKHRSLYSSYLLNLRRGAETVRRMIVSDIRCWLDLGSPENAADLLIVLRWFLSDHPEAGGLEGRAHVIASRERVRAPVHWAL